ncbi:MAG: DUF6702 family protein [Cyclobacteriaceae bacterium]|nr:hypothetical protein [Cyclobacteriaceae bacterium]
MVNILFAGLLLFYNTLSAASPLAQDHAIYLSVVEVAHETNSATASVKVKVFTDDISDAVSSMYGERVNLVANVSLDQVSQKVAGYFGEHLQLSLNGRPVALKLTQLEPMSDAIWFHFEISCPQRWDELTVKADYLMELFPTQSNVLSITQGEQKRFANIVKSKPVETIKF